MALAVFKIESMRVSWKTTLPHVNKGCKSPVFSLLGIESYFLITGAWSQFEKDESWTVDLCTKSNQLGPITAVAYIETENKYQRSGCCVQSCTESGRYKAILYVTRQNLLDDGIREDKISMTFVFHFDSVPLESKEQRKAKKFKSEHSKIEVQCLHNFSEDIEQMFNKEEYSDVVLKCDGRDFFVSKKILSARSCVFAAMFRNNMSESETGIVNITDMNSSVLEQFLRYVYSGRLESLSMDSIFDLYRAGDKYAMTSLKWKCSSFLTQNLSESNVCQVLFIADTFTDTELFDIARNFAVKTDKFLGTETWNEFAKANPALAVEVYKKFHTK